MTKLLIRKFEKKVEIYGRIWEREEHTLILLRFLRDILNFKWWTVYQDVCFLHIMKNMWFDAFGYKENEEVAWNREGWRRAVASNQSSSRLTCDDDKSY